MQDLMTEMSQGQKQVFAVARALVQRARRSKGILVVDEGTSRYVMPFLYL